MTSESSNKWSKHVVFLNIFTSKCASRHNGLHFFDIWTSKTAPRLTVFSTFHRCFAPQRRKLFQHLNFQKSSGHGVFWHFLLPNVLRATTECTFSTSQLPSAPRRTCFATFYFEMCFVPQQSALFQQLNFQMSSEHEVFWHFWLPNVLRAKMACAMFHLSFGELAPHRLL